MKLPNVMSKHPVDSTFLIRLCKKAMAFRASRVPLSRNILFI